MGLMRNEKGLKILNPASGRMVSAADPEVHISRLSHFGSGMGVDLTGLNPVYVSKTLSADSRRSWLGFGSHDEGLELPPGILHAAGSTIRNSGASQNHINQAVSELDHRFPYLHRGVGSDSTGLVRGSVQKDINALLAGPDEPSLKLGDQHLEHDNGHTERWGGETGLSHRGAAQRAREVFRKFAPIHSRIPRHGGFPSEASDLLAHGLANPDRDSLSRTRRMFPHNLGPQFLHVAVEDGGQTVNDMVDLKTGTWAKIHPDEYFPD